MTSAAVIPAGREPGPREPDGEHDPTGSEAPAPEEAALAATRPKLVELGVALVVVACPLVYLPASASPFLDLKRVVLLAACVLIWLGRPIIDRRLAAVAATWVGILTIASLAGVDRWFSLAGPDTVGSGLVLFAPCAYLLVIGATLPRELVARIPFWLFVTSIAVSVLAIVWRFAPGAVGMLGRDLAFDGATLGHPVLLAGMASVAAIAACAVVERRRPWTVVGLVVIASALSISTKRSGLVAVVVGLVLAWLCSRADRRRVGTVAGIVLATVLVWTVATPFVPSAEPLSGVERFQELASDSARARIVFSRVLLEATLDRPLLGWGPGNTWSAYLTHASAHDVELAQRGIDDPHDLLLGALVTSGLLGFVAFLGLIVLVVIRARRAPPARGWAVGVAGALFVFHLLQPVSFSLTPMLFLVAGIASASPHAPAVRAASVRARSVRAVVGVALVAGLALSSLILASSVLEQWGRFHNSEWALRKAMALAPGRTGPVWTLSLFVGQDATAGIRGADTEARELAAGLVRSHPLFPDARPIAVDVALVMNDDDLARTWLRRQLAVFPVERAALSEDEARFVAGGPAPSRAGLVQTESADAET